MVRSFGRHLQGVSGVAGDCIGACSGAGLDSCHSDGRDGGARCVVGNSFVGVGLLVAVFLVISAQLTMVNAMAVVLVHVVVLWQHKMKAMN